MGNTDSGHKPNFTKFINIEIISYFCLIQVSVTKFVSVNLIRYVSSSKENWWLDLREEKKYIYIFFREIKDEESGKLLSRWKPFKDNWYWEPFIKLHCKGKESPVCLISSLPSSVIFQQHNFFPLDQWFSTLTIH